MPLLLPDYNCYNAKQSVTREHLHKFMTGRDKNKFKTGATCYVDGMIFSDNHPKIDALIFDKEDYPLNLKLDVLDGTDTHPYVKVRMADKRRNSLFQVFTAASQSPKSMIPNCRTSHGSSKRIIL